MKTAEHIIETVDKLVRKYHTRDPYELCQLLGIKIHYYDLQKKLKGLWHIARTRSICTYLTLRVVQSSRFTQIIRFLT